MNTHNFSTRKETAMTTLDDIKESQQRIRHELSDVVRDTEEMLRHKVQDAGEGYQAAREKVERSLKKASTELHAAEEALVERTKKAARATDHYVHDHPWASIGVAAAAGLLLGLLVGRK
jgi:ElaB/YqjD/DUF883 family membrane-anchored ribosome-binding protein